MESLPTGTVTFLFTDIEGSTRLLQGLGDRYADVLAHHRRLFRVAFAEAGGLEVDTQGDAFFVAFPRARDAVLAAVAAQRAILRHRWPNDVTVRVRMGLHTGEPLTAETGYIGIDVHRAARIAATGWGGQILLSQTTRELVADDLPEGVRLRDLGEHRLKDLARPQHLFQLVASDLPADFPPLKSLNALPNNLPVQLTSLVGRGKELAEIDRLLENPSCRLLTLVGPGGIGKTRLALHAAAQRVEKHAHGAYFVPLTAVPSPEFLVPAVAAALQFSVDTHSSDQDSKSQLLDYLGHQSVLMVMDNFEHLAEGAPLLADMLGQASDIKLLVTSRERLNIQGEWTFDVKGMTYPTNGESVRVEDYSALTLFVERARQVDSGFSLSDTERPYAIRICRLVEGMPLGVELAAAWVATLSCKEIAEETERNLDFLATSMRDVPDKHRSLRAAFEHSWRLLTEAQQAGFRKLSVFPGGFRREAAMAVAGLNLPMLSDFVNKSLLRRNALGRYEMHELLRQYAAEKLSAFPEEQEAVREQHSHYYVQYLSDRAEALLGESMGEVREELRADLGNVGAALLWSVTRAEEAKARDALAALNTFYWAQGWHEGVDAFTNISQALQPTGDAEVDASAPRASVLLSALAHQAYMRSAISDVDGSNRIARTYLPVLRQHGYSRELAACLCVLGINAANQGNYSESMPHLIEGLALATESKNHLLIPVFQLWLGWDYYELGDYDRAGRYFQDCYRLCKERGNQLAQAFALSKLGIWADALREYPRAMQYHQEAREVFVQLGNRAGEAYTFNRMSFSAWGQGDHAEALRLGRAGYELFASIGHPWGMLRSLCLIGFAELGLGQRSEARTHFYEALERAMKLRLISNALYTLIGIGSLLASEGEEARAVELFAFALHHSSTPALFKGIAERALADLATSLPADVWAAARGRGLVRTLEEVVEAVSRDRVLVSDP